MEMAASTLTPSFHIKFGHAILPGTVTVGRFDGRHQSLAAGTTGGRILLHTPHDLQDTDAHISGSRASDGNTGSKAIPMSAWGAAPASQSTQLRFLNINRDITALCAGCLQPMPAAPRDVLLVGTLNSLQAYDVLENRDVFFRDVPDTVSALAVGAWTPVSAPLAIAGGNCSVQGFDSSGKDTYWTVTGDIVTSICFGDVTSNGKKEMLVGSDDFDIRCYRGEDIIAETTETDKITDLKVPQPGYFAYALANGTIGVYTGASFTRLWRVKAKMKAVALAVFDIDGDGHQEIIAAFANGRFEARKVATGELVYRDSIGTPIGGMAVADYRGDGKPLLLVVATDGEVRGYAQSNVETLAAIRAAAGPVTSTDAKAASTPVSVGSSTPAATVPAGKTSVSATSQSVPEAPQDDIASLLSERAKLDAELRQLEQMGTGAVSKAPAAKTAGAMPASSDIGISLDFNPSAKRIELVITASTGPATSSADEIVLRAVMLYALDAGIFGSERESHVVVSGSSTAEPRVLRVPLALAHNIATELRVQGIIGQHHSSTYYGVVEKPYRLPKFAMFQLLSSSPTLLASLPSPEGSVTFPTKERAGRIATWISKAFPVRADQIAVSSSASPSLDARFLNIRTGGMLAISVSHEHGGHVTMASDDLELCGELIQDLTAYLNTSDVESVADFPAAFSNFRKTLQKMEEYTAIRNRLTGDSAVASGSVKALVIQAEDARILADMASMQQYYGELRAVHEELLGEYAKRAANHAALVSTLKDINQMIQWCANVRVGEAKSRVIAACRACLKNNNPMAMIAVMQSGKAN